MSSRKTRLGGSIAIGVLLGGCLGTTGTPEGRAGGVAISEGMAGETAAPSCTTLAVYVERGGDEAASADFDGDGAPDQAVTTAEGFAIDGVAYDTRNPGTANGIHSLAAADLDGDGDVDLVAGDWIYKSLRIFFNDGTGGFSPRGCAAYPLPSAGGGDDGADHIAVADFDGDGALDLAVTSSSGPGVDVFRNRGNGSFAPARAYPLGELAVDGLAAGDFNHDDRPDLAIAGRGGTVTVLMNDGRGFQPACRSMVAFKN